MKYNKLIAEFMSINVITEDDIRANKNPISASHDGYLEEDLEYHSSWDWLMPVVDKCFDTHFEHSDDLSFLLKTFKPLEEVYKAVVEFINRTKKGA
tara:strand:+ start:200 stop:487 length:288 start_codon:yes stop_codon:yes gene_type:complete